MTQKRTRFDLARTAIPGARNAHSEPADKHEVQIDEVMAGIIDEEPKANSTMAVAMTAREVEGRN